MSEKLKLAKELLANSAKEKQDIIQDTTTIPHDTVNAVELGMECYQATANAGAPITGSREFDDTTLDQLNAFAKTPNDSILIARSEGGVFKQNTNTQKAQTLVLGQYEKSYYKTESLMSKITFSRSYNGEVEFLQIFKNEFFSKMGEGYSVGQEQSQNSFYKKEYEIINKINATELSEVTRSLDLKHYKNVAMLESDIVDQGLQMEKQFTRSLEYTALLSPTMRAITTMNGNQQGIKALPNTIHPIVAKNSDGYNVIMLNSDSGYEDGLFSLRDHYNNPLNRSINTRYATQISLPTDYNTATGRVNIDSLTQLLNVARGFSSMEHVELGNSNKGIAGQFGGKPIFVCTSKLYNAIVNQNKFTGTGSNSNEFSDNIAKLKELCDIQPMTMIGKTDGYNTGDLLGFFIYPKSYFIGNITEDDRVALKYNKNAWKESDAIIAQYYQNTQYGTMGDGYIGLARRWCGFGILPNPFSALTVLRK